MFLNEPARSDYDLNFRLFGFPVRIHPLFFLLPILFGARAGDGMMILIFALVFVVSILFHELGHAVVMRFFGQPARIVLHMMGGLAIADSGNSWSSTRQRFTSPQQILVSFAGPLAGFLLALIFSLIILALNGFVNISMYGILPLFEFDFLNSRIATQEYLQTLLAYGVIINVYLNLLNLIPVIPLDGGQISRQLFIQKDGWNGERQAVILSIVAAIAVGLYALIHGAQFVGIFFGFMAWSNWQLFQQLGGGSGYGGTAGRRPW